MREPVQKPSIRPVNLVRIDERWLQTFAEWQAWTFRTVTADAGRSVAGGYAAYTTLFRHGSQESAAAAARQAALTPEAANTWIGAIEFAYLSAYDAAPPGSDARIKDIYGKTGVRWRRVLHPLEDGSKEPPFNPSSIRLASDALLTYVSRDGSLKPIPNWNQYRPPNDKPAADLTQNKSSEAAARQQFDEAWSNYQDQDRAHQSMVEQHNRQADDWLKQARDEVPDAVAWYYRAIFDHWRPPGGIRQPVVRVSAPEVVVGVTVSGIDLMVPDMSTYVPDEVKGSRRADADMYRSYLAQVALLAMHRISVNEPRVYSPLPPMVANVRVIDVDPSTGNYESICALSVAATSADFYVLDMGALDPIKCVDKFGARWSGYPAKFQSVIPILDETLSLRPDRHSEFAAMSPAEFETCVAAILRAQGYVVTQTKATRDGGVDCYAFDPRPLSAGRIVVQAKRYEVNTPVGVGSVRDLLGVVHHGGHSKGVLMTTSRFTAEAMKWADTVPIELIDGDQLASLRSDNPRE